ncbi:MAG: hypothetical protein QOC98_1465 [Frankiaceae bacterium]|nr:hypothetical protein [Frankiaceae bacterium]
MTHPAAPRQLSLLAADATPPGLADLEGLLCGTGHVVRGLGALAGTARLSVLVDEPWRVAALEARLDELDLLEPCRAAPTPTRPEAVSVRTRFDARLLPFALRWTRGATPVAPDDLFLDGPRLWWWAVSAGVPDKGTGGRGFRLRLAASAPERWVRVGAALADVGVAGIFLGPRADGPAYRFVGTRRLRRLTDLVGGAPPGTPPSTWPSDGLEPGRARAVSHRLPEPSSAGDDHPPGTRTASTTTNSSTTGTTTGTTDR